MKYLLIPIMFILNLSQCLASSIDIHIGELKLSDRFKKTVLFESDDRTAYEFSEFHSDLGEKTSIIVIIFDNTLDKRAHFDNKYSPPTKQYLLNKLTYSYLHDVLLGMYKKDKSFKSAKADNLFRNKKIVLVSDVEGNVNGKLYSGQVGVTIQGKYVLSVQIYIPISLKSRKRMSVKKIVGNITFKDFSGFASEKKINSVFDNSYELNKENYITCSSYYSVLEKGTRNEEFYKERVVFEKKILETISYDKFNSLMNIKVPLVIQELKKDSSNGADDLIKKYESRCQALRRLIKN